MTVHVYLRNADFRRGAEIDDYQKLTITHKRNDVSVWTLDLNSTVDKSKLFTEATGIIVTEDGKPTFSGPVTNLHPTLKSAVKRNVVTGADNNQYLAERLALPSAPQAIQPRYSDDAYDLRTGIAETVLKGYVSANATAGGWSADQRLQNLLVAPDQHRGNPVTVQARFDNLRELLASTALAGGDLTFGIYQYAEDDPTLTFEVSVPRVSDARFSADIGNLAEYDASVGRPVANHVIVAGQGQGQARQFVEAEDADSIALWGRITGPLVDRRDTNDLAQLTQTATETLAKSASKTALSFKVSDTYHPDGTPNIVYGATYDLGDIATVAVDSIEVVGVIQQVERTFSPGAVPTVFPLIGTPETNNPRVLDLFAKQRATAARLSQLIRSQ